MISNELLNVVFSEKFPSDNDVCVIKIERKVLKY